MTGDRIQHIIKWLDWDKLTSWEEDFVISIETYFSRYGRLSEKQENLLEDLFRKKGQ